MGKPHVLGRLPLDDGPGGRDRREWLESFGPEAALGEHVTHAVLPDDPRRRELEVLLEVLPEDWRRAWRLLWDGERQEDVAERLGVSRQRVSQVAREAVALMRVYRERPDMPRYPCAVLKDVGLGHQEVEVVMGWLATPSQSSVAEETGLSRSRVARVLKAARAALDAGTGPRAEQLRARWDYTQQHHWLLKLVDDEAEARVAKKKIEQERAAKRPEDEWVDDLAELTGWPKKKVRDALVVQAYQSVRGLGPSYVATRLKLLMRGR